MFPTFDPAIARVLEAAGRLLRAHDVPVDAEAVISALATADDPEDRALARDPSRVQRALERLHQNGLLEAESGTRTTYRLTPLGHARIEGAESEE
jgi:DNA-binding MarR family transcriptional regulator